MCYRDEKGEMICEGYDEGPRDCEESSELTRLYIHFSEINKYM